jgi:predicted hotdog family 3-hydroxylacyl-ACP dehydratase
MSVETIKLPLELPDIKRILPHRHPFLLLDRIIELEEDRRVVGIKNVASTSATSSPGPAAGRCCRPPS